MTTTETRPAGTDLQARYHAVRQATEALAAPLSAEDQTVQSMPDTSPTKWHRAHVTWFFETFLLTPHQSGYQLFHPDFGYLFNSYYEAVGSRHPRAQRGLVSRPGVAEVAGYRAHVDEAMATFLAGELPDSIAALVELGCNHEQQHQELLLMDIKHVLSMNTMLPAYRAGIAGCDRSRPSAAESKPLGWIDHAGGEVDIGHRGDGFAFDNELPRHTTHLTPFALADRPVTCGDWLAFIDDGGYQRAELWLSDGWAVVQARSVRAPLYWIAGEHGEWRVFTLGGSKAVDPSEPVCHLSYYEADAYAHWAGARLPTEAEWEAVAASSPPSDGFDIDRLHPVLEPGTMSFGQVWEWTASAYLPYPGFRTAPGAVGEYNGKFMVGQHVLRGGSCVTPARHSRVSYRNFFPPGAQWPFTGCRLARNLGGR
jgi:ergothioneine biosynthesis protein EgtB